MIVYLLATTNGFGRDLQIEGIYASREAAMLGVETLYDGATWDITEYEVEGGLVE